LDDRDRISGGTGISLFATAFKLILGPMRPPIQWVPRKFSTEKSGQGVKLVIHPHLPNLRLLELYRYSPFLFVVLY
jgi:hypothetical protein